jgi:hypothetical protein
MIRTFYTTACALALFLLAGAAEAQGVLTFEAAEYDFGTVTEGDQPTYTFMFTNTGDQPVTLARVQPSCGCTTPSYTTDAVAPGAQGEIVVAYDSRGRPGEFHKSIAVEADGAEPRLTTLRISGTVVPATLTDGVTQGNVVLDAEAYAFGTVAAEVVLAHTFKLQNVGDRPLRIEEVRAFNDAVQVTAPTRPIFADEVVDIEVHVARAADVAGPDGTIDVAIVLATNDTDQPAKSLRLRGTLAPAAQAGAGTE